MENIPSNPDDKNMKKYDSQYYFIEQISDDRLPSLVADENTEDRSYSYERQPVGTPPLVKRI